MRQFRAKKEKSVGKTNRFWYTICGIYGSPVQGELPCARGAPALCAGEGLFDGAQGRSPLPRVRRRGYSPLNRERKNGRQKPPESTSHYLFLLL